MLNKNISDKIKDAYLQLKSKQFKKFNLNAASIIALSLALVLILYYGIIGAVLNSEIRKDVAAKIEKTADLNIVGVADYIINQEVQENLWTPSLPFFFPTYFLDNLPNFQLGEIKATKTIIKTIAKFATEDKKLNRAAKLLSYDGRIWMFEKGGVLPVPSAASQYKKGKALLKKSAPLDNGFEVNKKTFLYIINAISNSVAISLKEIDEANVEDNNIDDVFYYNQGKVYVYTLFLKAIAIDYKNVLIETNLYTPLTSAIKAMEEASEISPKIVKNADKSSSSANHLYNIGYYLQKANSKLNLIKEGLRNE